VSISAPTPYKTNTYSESWVDFGRNLEEYIYSNMEHLESESYDVILGFSRGGTILAFAFACLLKDSGSKIYSNPLKASVRPIPRGFTLKTRDSCFIMNQAATYIEISDIISNLENDLKYFKDEVNGGNPINVLIMDDNLTGATRVTFLEDILDDLKIKGIVANHKTLAYVRHRDFLESEIPTIINFPKDKGIEMFSMPWHKPSHGKKSLNFQDEKLDLVKFKFDIKSDVDLEAFKEDIKTIKHFRIKRDKFIVNGSSEFLLKYDVAHGLIKLNFITNKYYPPKTCLESKKMPINDDFLPLCSQDAGKLSKACCLMCSILNCNKELLSKAIDAAGSKKVSIELVFTGNSIKLGQAIRIWLRQKFPGIELEDL
jgi:hypothetical protein